MEGDVSKPSRDLLAAWHGEEKLIVFSAVKRQR
jgi:hypothetical protein